MIKLLILTICLLTALNSQTITPYSILPLQTTQNALTSYTIVFQTDTNIPSNAQVAIVFPFEFSPNALTQASRVRYALGSQRLSTAMWTINLYTFTISINEIQKGNITIVIDNILNPKDYTTSSYFAVQTLFKNVVVTSNSQFGRTPFTLPPVTTSGGTFANYLNFYIEQGASWTFTFTPSKLYEANSSLRFIFPQGFSSNGVQCNVSGVVDPRSITRVLPSQNVYDCLNLYAPLNGSLSVILSGLVNPNYETTVSGVQVHILQANNLIVQEIITSASSVLIKNKPLNATVKIPNQYRNNSATYIFQINTDTNLNTGDYMTFTFTGLWTLFTNATNIVEGVTSTLANPPAWTTIVNKTSSTTVLTLSGFSSILKSNQFTFYQPLMTPLADATYSLTISAFRSNGKLAQTFSMPVPINKTTGYIREMKLHPMRSPTKLPVGQTGPIQIVLFLRNDLPKTNVLTYGQIVIDIKPNIPQPIVALNGVPKCYFYYNIPAANCSFDSTTDPTKTTVTIYTPVDFNFQQSQIPLTITTEGFQQPQNQGITIDTLVKRYFFEIQFYSHLRPKPIPLEVLFAEWIPDSIPLNNSLACQTMTRNYNDYDHIKCTFTTPNQVLNDVGHIHFFRIQFSSPSSVGWTATGSQITPNYPCLMYGTNVSATPYVKCDFVTWTSGPHKSSLLTTSYNYITFYGLSTIPGGSTITFEIPQMQRNGWTYNTNLKFSILEDTPGYSSPIVYIYTQTVDTLSNSGSSATQYLQYPTITLTNSVINKVTDIILPSYPLGTTNPVSVLLLIDKTAFPNIGRGSQLICGTHTCSRFDMPIQQIIIYPSSSMGSSQTLTFPNITTPPYSGGFTFYMRVYNGGGTAKRTYFTVTITPDTITTKNYAFATNETITTLYPNSDHFYTISWTTVNFLQSQSGNSYINIDINNIFTLSSTYCQIVTTGTAYDGRGIICQLTSGGTNIKIKNLADLPAGSTFQLTLQMRSTSIASTVSPTVSIKTYYGNGNLVDQALNVPFAITPLTNTNLTVFNSFTIPSFSTSTRAITAGYFGHLLVTFTPESSGTVLNGSKIILTMPTEFTPATNSLGLPISCLLNGVRFSCTYTINPFTVTVTGTNSSFTTSANILNITTEYQNKNGIYYPSTQGRYLLKLQILNSTQSRTLEKVQQTIDILPGDVGYFNVTWAVKDAGVKNIYTVELKNGPNPIPSYNDGANAGRIYIGFPTINDNNGAVFASDLGFTQLSQGNVLPCYFQTGTNFVTATSGKSLTCKLRKSYVNNYYVWIEITNFQAIPAGGLLRVIIGKITNPASQQIDINFLLKITTLGVSTNIESPLYQTKYNMFIDMVASSITNRNQVNSSTVFFQAGAKVGMANQYFNITPYSAGTFLENDWWIIDLDPQFPLSGNIYNCQQPFYQYCIIYPTINWLAVKIGNGSIIPLQPFISQLPISISRIDTYFKCYTFMSGRWSQTITYTVTANYRWLELRGIISNFTFKVVGSQDKLNVGQKNVEVLVSFKVQHMVPKGGSIEIQFPNNATTVPAIKQHCRSAVTMGSALNGYNTGKPAVNIEGQVGCSVQNTYSWIITGFADLPANSQVTIFGQMDFPTAAVTSLGMGYICTYSNQDSNTFVNAMTIDYLATNFPLALQNLTWNLDPNMAMLKTEPLRVNYVGQLKFYVNFDTTFTCSSFGTGNSGEIYINLDRLSITGAGGGFGAPPASLVCTIFNPSTMYKYGCRVDNYLSSSDSYGYQILSYENLPANTVLQMTITSLQGSGTEGIPFPTSPGVYKTQIQINYCDSCSNNKAQTQYVEVYGPNWNVLYFNSTITIPSENNFVIVIVTPPSNIATDQQIVIEIPTVALDGSALFPQDLGMGYKAYDDLIFDLFESGISSMTCKVYPGKVSQKQPIKIVCSSFSATITSSMTVKFGFWVVNPSTAAGMAIPIQVYAYDQPSATKFIWSILEAGIRVLPITVTPISDLGNFVSSNPIREVMNTDFSFTARNTRAMVKDDWYILKFGFNLRQSANSNSSFKYNSGFGSSGDVIFMLNCKTVLLRVGTNSLTIVTPGSSTLNAKIQALFYNPSYQLNTVQGTILAFAIYNSLDECERVYYSDLFPSHPPNEPTGPTFTITPIYATNQMGMDDDWTIQFTMSSSATNSTSLVKLISIEFPASSTSDVVLQGRQCVQYITSTIQVDKCVIDIDSRVIWITPVVKNSYTDSSTLTIQTSGLAIKNPVTNSVNRNQFIIRYFTWPDGQGNPGIAAASDNWCFMRQDSTRITSSALSKTDYTSTYYSQHSKIITPDTMYINQWEPADYFIGNGSVADSMKKSPFVFKLIAPAAFSSLSGGSYHSISVNFGTLYSYPTLNQMNLDLYYYTPVCLLNGFSILQCSISGNTITMQFQQAIANGATVGVTFNIINPKDEADQGFMLANINSPTTTLPVQVYNSGSGVTYRIDPEPFHTYYRATSAGATYPSFGIQDVTLVYGTQVQGQLNYLQFTLTLTRTDINGFVIEIPVIAQDGSKIYTNPTLMGLSSGSQYPCSLGPYVPVFCYYTQGSSNGFGTPTRIYVTGFSTPSTTFNFKMLFTNPDNSDVFPSFTWKAFGGSYTVPDLMGKQLKGIKKLVDPFKVYTTTNYYSTGTLKAFPNQALWQTNTYYDFYTDQENLIANTYAILKWPLVDPTYGTIGDYTYDSAQIYDHFFMFEAKDKYYVYLVKKLTGGFTASTNGAGTYAPYDYITSYYRFSFLRMKHHIVNGYQLYLLMKPSTKIYTATVYSSWINSYRVADQYGAFSIANIDTQVRINTYNGWQFVSIRAGNIMSAYSNTVYDPSEKIVEVQFYSPNANVKPYSSLSSTTTDCALESGLIGSDPLRPIYCYLDRTNNRILFYNVFWFTNTYLNFYYYATTNSDQSNFDVKVNVWANIQAFTDGNWLLFSSQTASSFTYDDIYYASYPSYSAMSASERSYGNNVMDLPDDGYVTNTTMLSTSAYTRTEGYADVFYLSSTQIKIRLYTTVSRSFSQVFRMGFRFYTPRLISTSCSSVSVWTSRWGTFPFSGSASSPGSSSSYCGNAGTNTRRFYAIFDMYYTPSNSQNSNQWPSFSGGDTYEFTFTFSSISSDGGSYIQYLWVSASMVFQNSYYYYQHSICGCGSTWCCGGSCCCWYCCSSCCNYDLNCRDMRWWDYYTFTGTQGVGYEQPSSAIASSVSVDLLSRQYGTQTQFSFYLQSLAAGIDSTMTSTTNGAHAELLIELAGNTHYPTNPFPYTDSSESSAYVECLCVSSASAFTISYSTSYTPGNCTRHLISGHNPLITVRYNSNAGTSLRCFFPGFIVPDSSAYGTQVIVNFYWNPMHIFNKPAVPSSYYSSYQSTGYTINLNSNGATGFQSFSEGGQFWTTYGQVNQQKRYYLYLNENSAHTNPSVYYSNYYPIPSQTACANSGFTQCRTYSTFINRRYFMVATINGYTDRVTFDYTASFPASKDASSSFYNSFFIGWTAGSSSGYYYTTRSTSINSGYLTEATPTYAAAVPIYGSTLRTYSTAFVVSVDLNGYTLYSNQRTSGSNQGSFIQLTTSGFSTLYGCGARLHYSNRQAFYNNALYCLVISSTQIKIWSNSDIAFTGKLIITLATGSMPTSTTFTFELYDKYISGSDYARSVVTTTTISNNPTGVTVLPNTNILWRRMAYKQLRSDAGPLRVTLNNNFQYVSTYNTTSNSVSTTASNGIIFLLPTTLTTTTKYECRAREYLPTQYHLYTEYLIDCSAFSTTQVLIQSLPSHILNPAYYYEFIVYVNAGSGSPLISASTGNNFFLRVWSGSNYGSFSTTYFDEVPISTYVSTIPTTLNGIYILTREAAAINSLYIDFTVGVATTAAYYLEFTLDPLDLSYFNIQNGQKIPCYISGLSAYAGKANGPTCFGYAAGVNGTSPLIVRLVNFASFSANKNIKVAFDNFNNPPIQTLFRIPINLKIKFIDAVNEKQYTSSFPNIYFSDSINIRNTAKSTNSLSANNGYHGASTYYYWTIGWPYSSSGNIDDKIVMKIKGGATCCSPFSSLSTLSDNYTYYTNLWINTKANTSVYAMPSRSVSTTIRLYISNVVNPNPVSYNTYQQGLTAQFGWYSNYQTYNIYSLTQPDYTAYTKNSDFVVCSSPSFYSTSGPNHFNSHQYYPLIYEFSWNYGASSYPNRNLSYIILYFTGGVRWIDTAWFRYQLGVINKAGSAKVGYNTGNSQWFVNVTGIQDSYFSSSYNWYLRVKLYANNNNYISYSSYLYNYNGQQQFSTSTGAFTPSNNGFSTSSLYGTPNMWTYQHLRYTYGYYQLQRTSLLAKAALTTNKLFFKFTTPYSISEVENFKFISSSNSYPASTTPNNGLYCVIQPATTKYVSYGAGLYAPCSYSSPFFTVNAPKGGLVANTEYLLTIIDRQQLSSTFSMPTSPQRVEISLIYNSMLNLAYGDVYTLDFAAYMTSYSMDHSHLMSSYYDMLGFNLRPSFALSASSTSSPITQSVLSFEVESKYYDACLGISGVFSPSSMPFCSGVYYSHYASNPVANANTRIKCGKNTQTQNWAPAILSITDYGALSTATSYYFRFPLITLPSGTNVPLTYKVRLLYYANGVPYPTIISFFNYEAKYICTGADYDYNKWAALSLSSNTVQTTMSMSFYYLYDSYGNGAETLVKFQNNFLPALTSLSTLTSISQGSYNYQYYPNINLCSFVYVGGSSSNSFTLGTYPTSTDREDFTITFVQTFHGTTRWKGWFNSGTNVATYTVSEASGWTSSSIAKGTNLLGTNSWDKYTVTWSANYLQFPEGSYMIVTFGNYVSLLDQYCVSYTGFIQGTQPNSNLVCKRYSSNQILIAGYATLAPGATLSITVYMAILDSMSINSTSGSNNDYSTLTTITVISSSGNYIISSNTNSITLSLSNIRGSNKVALYGTMNTPYTAGTTFPLFITFQLNTHSLVNGDYLQIDFGNWVIDTATTGKQVFKYQFAGSKYWIPSAATQVSGNVYKVPVYSNYSMNTGNQITLWVDTFAPTTYYGAQVPNSQWNTFKIYAYKSGALVEQEVFRVWTEPYGHASFAVTAVLNYAGVSTLYQFTVTPNITATAGDTILIEFTTADNFKTSLFSNTLGATIPSPNPGYFDCNQAYNTHVISNNIISCRVYAGNNAASPSIPTTIAIPITKNIPANTLIKFNILGITNPSVYTYPIGVVFKLANTCNYLDLNNLCAYYKSVTYMTFNSAVGLPTVPTTGSLTFNPTRVSATNSVHTLAVGYTVNSGSWLKITYYSQVPIPSVCSLTSANGQCYSYPTGNIIMIKAGSTQSGSFSFSLGGMTNPYQYYYGTNIYTQIWSSGVVSNRFYTSYSAATITTDPTSSETLDIYFTPTLTPNYQLKYSFQNIALVQITHLLQNKNIQQIYITTGGEITLDTQYCNATMQTYPGEALPYPYRFICSAMGSNYVRLNMQADFPAWNSNFTGRSVFIYLKYTISNGQTNFGNYWYAKTYTDPSSTSSNYLVSQATGRFAIVEYLLPYLYVISLWTRSFVQRTCVIGQQCMFYGFLLPTTPRATMTIDHMTFLLPKEFNYTATQTLNRCTVQPTTNSLWTFSCGVSRQNSQITISYSPGLINYDQNYNLITLDNTIDTVLFTAPKYPGNHYQMQVNLWSPAPNNYLVESQYINITTVYGYYLSVPDIVFTIPSDGGAKGLFDLTFKVGVSDILPAYESSASNSVTSAIELSFANTYAADLGTGLQAGAEIACLHISGLTFNTMGKIKCQIYPSVSTITYPTIIVTGYDRIYASSIVRIQFANLKTLPTGVTDYCKLGVSLTYYYYGGVKGYIYEPVSFVTGPPTAPATPKAITFTVSQLGSNTVGQLTDYTFSGSIASGFTPVTTSDYFVVQFPPYTFEGRFHLNFQALCSLASGNKCSVFGLASQIYIQPSATVSASAFSFTITKLLNAAFSIMYLNKTITIFTVVNKKINALGTANLLKFTQPSSNVSAIITSIGSIYGGDSGINYFFNLQLNSYLPEQGKISIFFPTVYTSLFTVGSKCFLRDDSQLLAGSQAYCSIINNYQLVIVPNGVLLSQTLPYYITVTNITNPNFDISSYKFTIEIYYSSSVYNPSIISKNQFSSPKISLITVKECKLQVDLSIYNPELPSQYQLSLICPSPIRQASELKVYLSWGPPLSNGTCSSDSTTLYSTQCSILNEYSSTTKLTYLSVYLRSISAQKLITITGTIKNAIQGTYTLKSTIGYNGFVYMNATSNSFYITSSSTSTSATAVTSSSAGTIITSSGQAISIKSSNYPLNRQYSSIYTFAVTRPSFIVSTVQVDIPSIISQSANGINCGYQAYAANDNYFNLMIKEGTNPVSCNMTGQKITISGLTNVMSSLTSNNFLYITVNGLLNPQTSVKQTDFTFTFINTTSTYTQAVLLFTIPLSYSVSDPPANMQIGAIYLSNDKYFSTSDYTFVLSSVNGANLTITKKSSIGVMIKFPTQYADIWNQIATPSVLNVSIGANTYTSTNITLGKQHLFAVFDQNTFPNQLNFTAFNISFTFRNPNKSIDCSVLPVFVLSIFDFKGNSIYSQTLSNNQICPSFSTYLYGINITGNTKISAGSSSPFYITLQKSAKYLSITPSCTSSAISFSPSTIIFQNYDSKAKTFNISAANGLSGQFNVTFTKSELSSYTFYNDIQFITLNVYVPTTKYFIKITPFTSKSVGTPIAINIQLEVSNPTTFALITTTNCSSSFVFDPENRITIPAQATNVNFTVTYKGTSIPAACSQTFKISSVSTNNYYLDNPTVYYSASLSIDKTWIESPMVLQLTTTPKESSDVGHTIISSTSSSATKYTPAVYNATKNTIGSNSANFTVTTSYIGTIYYAIVTAGTPTSRITLEDIYNHKLTSGITYGQGTAALQTSGVNTVSTFLVSGLSAQTSYTLAVYLNSTVGNSPIYFLNFTTAKISNAASIKIAMSSPINQTHYVSSLSQVLRINISRIYILTNSQVLSDMQSTYHVSVMNKRSYIYDTLIAPNPIDDSIKPIDLLKQFVNDTNAKKMLAEFEPEYILSFNSPVREVFNTVPKIRIPIKIVARTYQSVTFSLAFWGQAFVYAVILQNSNQQLLSTQIINGLDENNTKVISQHYANVTTDEKGVASITFKLLNDNSSYSIYASAECLLPFKPRLALSDSQILKATFTTSINPNLQKNKDNAISAISKQNPALGEEADKLSKYVQAQKKIQGVDKTKKTRTHD